MKKSLVAVATIAALGAATLPTAQAHDRVGPIIAGAVIGAVVGTVLTQSAQAHAPAPVYGPPPAPVVYAPPPRVVYAPAPRVVYVRQPVVIHEYHRHGGWKARDRWDHGRDRH